MAITYTPDDLRTVFQSEFDLAQWYDLLKHLFGATELKVCPEKIDQASADEGYYLGSISTSDSYRVGLFHYRIAKASVVKNRVGLRNLVKSFINPTWGEFDAALVVFDSGVHWRLSFICEIKGESSSPKRCSFVFGDAGNHYHTAVNSFLALQSKGVSFASLQATFSVEPLTKEFYKDLFAWYLWAVSPSSNISFPSNPAAQGGGWS